MDQDLDQRLSRLEQKLDHIERSTDQMRRVILWTAIISLALIFFPLIGLAFAIPTYLRSLNIDSLLQ